LKHYGISVLEKIKSRKEIARIFNCGKNVYSDDNKLKAKYILIANVIDTGVLFAVTVAKKQGNSVWRNRVKRLIREAYRHNKIDLIKYCKNKNVILEIIFSPKNLDQSKNRQIKLVDIEPPLKEILAKIKEEI
jgi:ribonuclease P protein component